MSGRFARSTRRAAAAGGVSLLLLAFAAWGLARSGAVNTWLTGHIAALVGPHVRFAAARAVWWPRLAVVLDDVALVPLGSAPAAGAASAAAVTCRVRLIPLLSGRAEIAAVGVDGLHLTVERGGDGSLRAGGLEALAASMPSGRPAAASSGLVPAVQVHDAEVVYRSAGDARPRAVRLQRVDLQFVPDGAGARVELSAGVDGGGSLRAHAGLDSLASLGAVRYTATVAAEQLDAAAALAWLPRNIEGVSAQGRLRLTANLTGRGSAAVEGDAALELSDGVLAWLGWQVDTPLRLATHAAWDGASLALSDGRLDAARLGRATLAAETLAATFAYRDGVLRVDAAEWRACGGTWRPSGSVTLADPPRIDGSLTAEGIDGAQLASGLSALGVPGPLPQFAAPLRLTAQATGALGGAWTGHAGLETDGAVTWSNARVEGPLQLAGDAQVTAATGAASAGVAVSNGLVQARRLAVGGLALDALDGAFSYAGGTLRAAALHGNAYGGAWRYSGSLPVAAAAPWTGQLDASGVSAAALGRALAEPGNASAVDGAVDLSAQLAGTGASTVSGRATVRLASAGLTWDDVRVERPAEVSATLRVQGTRLTLSNGELRAHRVRVRELGASALHTDFGYADGTLRLAGLQARAFGGRWHASGAASVAGAPTWSGTVKARHVDLGALLHAADSGADGPHSHDGIADLTVTLAHGTDGSPHGSATVTLTSGSFLWGNLHVDGPAHASGAFALRGETFSLKQAAAEARRAAYGPLVGSAAAAHFQYVADTLSFTDLTFTSCGGTWTHNGWFKLDSGGPFAGELSIEGAAPRELAAMLGDREANVPFARVDVDSEFHGRATPEWTSDLGASGTVSLSDGTMRSTVVLRPIWEALVGRGRVLDALDRPTTHVQEMRSTFTLRGDEVDTPDFSLISDDYAVSAVGTIGLDGTLDLAARIQLTALGVQKMLVFSSMPLPTSALPGLPPIPTYVTGSVRDPVLRPNVAALPAATVRWVVGALLHAPRSLGGAVVHHLGQLWDGAKRAVGVAPE